METAILGFYGGNMGIMGSTIETTIFSVFRVFVSCFLRV